MGKSKVFKRLKILIINKEDKIRNVYTLNLLNPEVTMQYTEANNNKITGSPFRFSGSNGKTPKLKKLVFKILSLSI
ncbi:hypothetical protein GCM10022258_25050 [Aquimarina gracilis]